VSKPLGSYAHWMQFQKGQAPHSDALLKRIDELERMVGRLNSLRQP